MITLDSTGIVLLAVMGLCFLVQMVYYWVFLLKPSRFQKTSDRNENETGSARPSVSVIICAKNESENLRRFLPRMLEQDYSQYEVIVVNDGSTDESEEVLGELEKQYSHLYRTYIPQESKYLSRKKLAMMVGIKAAKYDVLLFTEADCEPVSRNWISLMVRHHESNCQVVIGMNLLSKKKGLLHKFAAYDHLINGLQMLSLALFHRPYCGNGRNLAYKKELFYEQKGYSKYMNLQAGEDDLFINQVATSGNTSVEISPESQTHSYLEGFYVWKELKIRKATTQRYYKSGPVAFWRFEIYTRCIFIIAMVTSIVYGWTQLILPVVAGILFFIRFFSHLYIVNRTSNCFQTEKFYLTLPLFDFLQPFFDSYFHIHRIFRGKKDYTWK